MRAWISFPAPLTNASRSAAATALEAGPDPRVQDAAEAFELAGQGVLVVGPDPGKGEDQDEGAERQDDEDVSPEQLQEKRFSHGSTL